MQNITFILKILIIVIVAGLIVGYTYYRVKDFAYGPKIIITSPINGITVDDVLLEISGNATRISYFSINDRQIFTNEAGNFKEKLLLFPGYNIISIKASDKFDRKIERTLEVVYRAPKKEPPKTETIETKMETKTEISEQPSQPLQEKSKNESSELINQTNY